MSFDFESIIGGLVLLFAAAILVESSLSMLFDWRWWKESPLDSKGLKTLIAIAASWLLCYTTNFDILCWWFSAAASSVGMAFTALTIAGGSKKVVNLFAQVKDFKTEVTTTTTTTRGTVPAPVVPVLMTVPTVTQSAVPAQAAAADAKMSAAVAQVAAGHAQEAVSDAQSAAGEAQDAAGDRR